MTLKTAVEVKNKTAENIQFIIEKKIERARKFANGAVAIKIEQAADRGDMMIDIEINTELDEQVLQDILRNAGYEVVINNDYKVQQYAGDGLPRHTVRIVRISWSNAKCIPVTRGDGGCY